MANQRVINIRHQGDTAETLATARPHFDDGAAVRIDCGGWTADYFDFVVATRRNDDEPLLELIRHLEVRRAMKRGYKRRIIRMCSHYATQLGRDYPAVYRRFRLLHNEKVEPGSAWDT